MSMCHTPCSCVTGFAAQTGNIRIQKTLPHIKRYIQIFFTFAEKFGGKDIFYYF